MDSTKYNSAGIAQPQNLGSKSPKSNPGVVYQPANIPTNPGGTLQGQQFKNLLFRASDGSSISIATSLQFEPTLQQPGTIAFLDSSGNAILIIGGVGSPKMSPISLITTNGITLETITRQNEVSTTQSMVYLNDATDGAAALLINVPNGSEGISIENSGTGTENLLVLINSNSSNNNSPLQIVNNAKMDSHFWVLENLVGKTVSPPGILGIGIYLSDGTTPNGNLSSVQGSICYNGPSGQPFYCTGTTNWTGF